MPVRQRTTALDRLWQFHGGMHLDAHKEASTRHGILQARLPTRLVLPLQQHIGAPAKPTVAIGERVLKGQTLAQADGYISANLHAPTSGVLSAIEDRPVAHPSGLAAPCLVLDADGRDEWCELPPPLADYSAIDPAALRQRVREAGIVGLGGGAFPASVKLDPGPHIRIQLLILNGAECEPYITCDDMMMRNRAHEVIGGLLIMRHMLQVRDTIIGVEDNKPQALAALEQALADSGADGIQIRRVPTIYPTGGEKQLIRVLTGREVPSHGIPPEMGLVCHNVGTAVAVFESVMLGQPLISRYVTVTGPGVRHPQVLDAVIGTPVSDLVEQCGGYGEAAHRLIIGGPMMGFAVNDDAVPIVKGSNCVLVTDTGQADAATTRPSLPCIRCGDCVRVCPANLLPQQLYWYARAKEFDKVQDYHLFDCIECGCCAAVCPSHIPLVQYYRFSKTAIWAQDREREKADAARQRHETRLARLEREQQERALKLARKKASLRSTNTRADPKKAAIDAALARVKAKQAATLVASTGKSMEPAVESSTPMIGTMAIRRDPAE